MGLRLRGVFNVDAAARLDWTLRYPGTLRGMDVDGHGVGPMTVLDPDESGVEDGHRLGTNLDRKAPSLDGRLDQRRVSRRNRDLDTPSAAGGDPLSVTGDTRRIAGSSVPCVP